MKRRNILKLLTILQLLVVNISFVNATEDISFLIKNFNETIKTLLKEDQKFWTAEPGSSYIEDDDEHLNIGEEPDYNEFNHKDDIEVEHKIEHRDFEYQDYGNKKINNTKYDELMQYHNKKVDNALQENITVNGNQSDNDYNTLQGNIKANFNQRDDYDKNINERYSKKYSINSTISNASESTSNNSIYSLKSIK